MELGERLRQARLEKGLSQRQLCGGEITRNMLSQIENGSAKPSMGTLQYLAGKLGKTVGYFLEEGEASPNQSVMASARKAWQAGDPQGVLSALEGYDSSDDTFREERGLLEKLAGLALAEKAISEKRFSLAETLLQEAEERETLYTTKAIEREGLLLRFSLHPEKAADLAAALPDITQELLLRGSAALAQGDTESAGRILDAALPTQSKAWHLLRGKVFFKEKAYASAIEHFLAVGETGETLTLLERCYRELEDYKMAYHYACKLRERE